MVIGVLGKIDKRRNDFDSDDRTSYDAFAALSESFANIELMQLIRRSSVSYTHLDVYKRQVHIIDFGCGKSYLTFALYYYLHELKGQDVAITGLDLKQDVIRHCNDLARSYGYEKLQFLHGDIAKYEGCDEVDMVAVSYKHLNTSISLVRKIDNLKILLNLCKVNEFS